MRSGLTASNLRNAVSGPPPCSQPFNRTFMKPSKAILIGVFGALAALAGLVAAQLMLSSSGVKLGSGTLLKQPRTVEAFTLRDTSGAPFDNRRLSGQWSLVFAGFTFCPDVCPNTLGLLKSLNAKLDEAQAPLQVVFVSVDPERDSLDRLDTYVHYFDPRFVGVTGEVTELEKLARSMSLVFAKVPGATPDSYTMDHSSALVLINPQGQVVGYFLPPHRLDALTADLLTLIRSPS
jgi:protein SCO1/2